MGIYTWVRVIGRDEHTFLCVANKPMKQGCVGVCYGEYLSDRGQLILLTLRASRMVKDVTLYQEHENDQLVRFVVFVYHQPPALLLQNTIQRKESGRKWRSLYGRQQNLLLTVAARLG
jgi:hypothetical protein